MPRKCYSAQFTYCEPHLHQKSNGASQTFAAVGAFEFEQQIQTVEDEANSCHKTTSLTQTVESAEEIRSPEEERSLVYIKRALSQIAE